MPPWPRRPGLAAAGCAPCCSTPRRPPGCPSPALRRASRAQGRGLLRAGRRMWPEAFAGAATSRLSVVGVGLPDWPMWPVALGVVAAVAGLPASDAALAAAQASVAGPAWAATRLLGLDPFAVARCLADLAPAVDATASAGHPVGGGRHRPGRTARCRCSAGRHRRRSPRHLGGAPLCLVNPHTATTQISGRDQRHRAVVARPAHRRRRPGRQRQDGAGRRAVPVVVPAGARSRW